MIVATPMPPPTHSVHQCPFRGAAPQLVDHGRDEHRAGGAERVAHRDGAAVDVHVLLGQVQVPDPLQDDGGEGLVEFEQVDVVELQASRRPAPWRWPESAQ